MDAYSFKLAWRWTQPTHNVLPPDVMAQIKPLAPSTLTERPMVQDQLNPLAFDKIVVTRANGAPEEISSWLRQLPVAPAEQVVLRWDVCTAVQTTWDIFTRFWDDFCYPSSDDVEISPVSCEWLFLYHHSELIEWGRRYKVVDRDHGGAHQRD